MTLIRFRTSARFPGNILKIGAMRHHLISAQLWICLSLLVVIVADLFTDVDLNKNGSIDRNEFGGFLSKIHRALDPVIGLNSPINSAATAGIGQLMNIGANFVSGFVNSLVVILVTEIGDKTFFIAAVLAMRNARIVVYLGSMSALAAMHILSSFMGFALPALLPRAYTHIASIVLFVYFGIKLLKDAYDMDADGPSDELHEVEEELIHKKEDDGSSHPDVSLEEGENGKSKSSSLIESENLKVFTQALTLTFLAEWGDRSQIATIALAASKNVYGVILGGLIGHAFCTGLAVVGGRLLAARISERTVAIIGGSLFLIFAISSFISGSDL